MDLQEMITFVRLHADTDEQDAPDASLTVYARAAYNDIRRRVPEWRERHGSDTLTVVAGTDQYALNGASFASKNIEYVTGVSGPTSTLVYIPFEQYVLSLDGNTTDYSTQEADSFSLKNGVIYLFPAPTTTAVTYTVYGYTTFTDWPTAGGDPDLPREFDEAICWYMLAKYYTAQEDLELAQLFENTYEISVGRYILSAMRTGKPTRVLGGGRRRSLSYGAWVRRNTEGS